jgi:hypothetical protein
MCGAPRVPDFGVTLWKVSSLRFGVSRNEHVRDPDLESSLGHCILVDPAILHNDQKVFVGIFDEL